MAGIAEAYEPASLLNKKVVIVANLKPAKLMGVESNGMIVAASVDGKPVLATFTEDVAQRRPAQVDGIDTCRSCHSYGKILSRPCNRL